MSYGLDTWCSDSLRTGRLASGRVLVAQALYRRQITPRGTLRGGDEEANYGIDLAGYVGADPALSAVILPGIIRGELLKDDRVSDVVVEVLSATTAAGLVTLTITESVLLHGDSEPFSLTIAVSAVGAVLLGITA